MKRQRTTRVFPAASTVALAPLGARNLWAGVNDLHITNWFSGTPDLGSFNPAQIRARRLMESGSVRMLESSSPLPSNTHRLESRASLSPDRACMAFN